MWVEEEVEAVLIQREIDNLKKAKKIKKIVRKKKKETQEVPLMIPSKAGCLIIYKIIFLINYSLIRKSSKKRSYDESFIMKNGY